MNFAFVVQAAHTDWSGGVDHAVKRKDGKPLIEYVLDCIVRLKRRIHAKTTTVLLIPEQQDSLEYFAPLAKKCAIHFFAGSADDVLDRYLKCCHQLNIDCFARIIGSYWYLDEELFMRMYQSFMEDGPDLLRLPQSFPKGFGADFVRVTALQRLDEEVRKASNSPITAPFVLLDKAPDRFVVQEFGSPPKYASDHIELIRAGRRQYEPERIDFVRAKALEAGSIDRKRYLKATELLPKAARVLDIACGGGYGSALLADQVGEVMGGDYDPGVIAECKRIHRRGNLTFECQDVTQMSFAARSFDAVVSMETVEHVDSASFVSEVARVLRGDGLLVLSTPQNDWGFNLVPWHVKEYSVGEIRTLLAPYFSVTKVYGVASHEILETSESGDRMLVVARKR